MENYYYYYLFNDVCNCNRNCQTSEALLGSQAQGGSFFMSTVLHQRASSKDSGLGLVARGGRVAVKVGQRSEKERDRRMTWLNGLAGW